MQWKQHTKKGGKEKKRKENDNMAIYSQERVVMCLKKKKGRGKVAKDACASLIVRTSLNFSRKEKKGLFFEIIFLG